MRICNHMVSEKYWTYRLIGRMTFFLNKKFLTNNKLQ